MIFDAVYLNSTNQLSSFLLALIVIVVSTVPVSLSSMTVNVRMYIGVLMGMLNVHVYLRAGVSRLLLLCQNVE